MAISDTLIELLSFSKEELLRLARALRKTVPAGGDKYDVAEALAGQLTLKVLREEARDYVGAGRTSLSWVVLRPASDDDPTKQDDDDGVGAVLTTQAVTIGAVEKALRQLTGKANPFASRLRPSNVTSEPALVNAQWDRGEDLVFFTFAFQRTQRMVVRNFEVRRQPEDSFFHVVLRMSRGVVEVRAESRTAGKVIKGWVDSFAEALGRQALRLTLTEQDVAEMQTLLEAGRARHVARHEDGSGYARQMVTAVEDVDLTVLEKFREDFEGTDPVSSDLLFDFVDEDGEAQKVRIRISPRAGTVQCVNHVSNEVMERLFDALREVRAARTSPSGSHSTALS